MLNLPNKIMQRVVGVIDGFNDRFSMYRLVLYFLLTLVGWTVVGSFLHQSPYSWHQIIISAAWLSGVCYAVNKLLAKFLDVPANRESDLISGLILALILTPATTAHDYLILAAAATVAMASKYILVFRRSHIFNPAALGAMVAGVVFHQYASWWVGTKFTTPLIVLGGVLILRKVKRFQLVLVFLAVYVLALIWTSPAGGTTDSIRHLILLGVTSTSVLFFATIMLCEPLTSPARLNPVLIYGLLVGACYSYGHLGISPEQSLLIGNAFTFIFAPNHRYKLDFIRQVPEAQGIYSFVFSRPSNLKFKAGQYLEWTLAQHKSDARGNRRYLTISSAPSDNELMFSVKMPDKPSAFKQQLASLKPGDHILAAYLSGSFSLPQQTDRKLAFLAGGVGITPFHSMIKELVNSAQARDISLIYAASTPQELAFSDLFKQARAIGLKSFYTDQITQNSLASSIPDWQERDFYVSGPYGFVQAMEKLLLDMGLPVHQIVTDYFPGYGG